MPEELVEAGNDAGGNEQVAEGNYVTDVLLKDQSSFADDEPAERETTEPEDNTDEVAEPEETATAADTQVAKDPVEALIQKLAKELGLDPNNPNQLKALKKLAHQDSHILKIQAENKGYREGKQPTENRHLTALERSLLAAEKPADAAAKPADQQTSAQANNGVMRLGDVSDAWFETKNPIEAAYKDLNDAWVSNDVRKVAEVENAMWTRRFAATGMPVVQQMVQREAQRLIEEKLGPLLGDVRPLLDQRDESESRDRAISELKNIPDFADVEKLLEPDQEGELVIDGESFPNNPLNRIVSENPWLLNIHRDHPDAKIAKALTKTDIYRLAYNIYKKDQKPQGIDPAKAAELVAAGQQVARRTAADKARHGVNAGGGAGRGPQGDQSYVEHLNNRASTGSSFSSLFSS